MARPQKKGLEYFPTDIGMFQDIKIRKLIKNTGGESVAAYICLICNIYKEGYYIEWDDDMLFYISEDSGMTEEYIASVLSYCIEIGLFNKSLFEKHQILTSIGVQKRYQEVVNLLRRNSVIAEFNLINPGIITQKPVLMPNQQDANVASTAVIPVSMHQRKEKKRKEKKRKGNFLFFSVFFSQFPFYDFAPANTTSADDYFDETATPNEVDFKNYLQPLLTCKKFESDIYLDTDFIEKLETAFRLPTENVKAEIHAFILKGQTNGFSSQNYLKLREHLYNVINRRVQSIQIANLETMQPDTEQNAVFAYHKAKQYFKILEAIKSDEELGPDNAIVQANIQRHGYKPGQLNWIVTDMDDDNFEMSMVYPEARQKFFQHFADLKPMEQEILRYLKNIKIKVITPQKIANYEAHLQTLKSLKK